MLQRIYHGSENIIKIPIYGFGKLKNDYGLGFYCTDSLEMAKEWGVSAQKNGYANIYDFETKGLKTLNLNDDKYCILHWLAILLQNRTFDISSSLGKEAKDYLLQNFSVDYSTADVMIGYRADDSYFSFAQDFLNGTISYRQLNNAMHLGKLGQQIVLKSEKAFKQISFVGAEIAEAHEWFAKREMRDRTARRDYLDSKKNGRIRNDLYITYFLDEEIKADDARLR